MRTPIFGHTSQETAYMIDDYPYGRLRCKRRVWIEFDSRHGFRFVAQTENPKNGRWNAPKKSTYVEIAACLYLDENRHVQWATVTALTDAAKALEFAKEFGKQCEGALNLAIFAKRKAPLSHALATGAAHFTINGQKQERTEAEKARDLQECETWLEVAKLLGEG